MAETKYQMKFRLHDTPARQDRSTAFLLLAISEMFSSDEVATQKETFTARVRENSDYFDGYSCLVTWKQLAAFANCFTKDPAVCQALISVPGGHWQELWWDHLGEWTVPTAKESFQLDYDVIWRVAPEGFQK
jgi:hypothetical protein